jgi:nucleotide-binding universal stress UspA family protein
MEPQHDLERDAGPLPVGAETDPDDTRPAVVIGLDGSETSWHAFSWGCGEARRLGGRAVAVFVSPRLGLGAGAGLMVGIDSYDHGAVETAVRQHAEWLRIEALARAVSARIELTFLHTRGDPASELLRVASEIHADVTAIGRSTKLCHRLTGALSRRLLAKPGAPIIVVVP